jgi:hypothetical protein
MVWRVMVGRKKERTQCDGIQAWGKEHLGCVGGACGDGANVGNLIRSPEQKHVPNQLEVHHIYHSADHEL